MQAIRSDFPRWVGHAKLWIVPVVFSGCLMNEPQSDNVSTQPVRTYPPADDEMNLYNAPRRTGAELWAQLHPEEAGQFELIWDATAMRMAER